MKPDMNSLNWFEIPATDIKRAQSFYEKVFNMKMENMEMGDNLMAFFPWNPEGGKVHGSLVQSPDHVPSMDGSVIYLNGDPDLSDALSRVEEAGGKIIVPKMAIGEHGFIAFMIDSEGNKVGFHSNG